MENAILRFVQEVVKFSSREAQQTHEEKLQQVRCFASKRIRAVGCWCSPSQIKAKQPAEWQQVYLIHHDGHWMQVALTSSSDK